jgi:hypothetical protein
MARVCHLISSELQHLGKPLQSGDILLDWGCGAGNWLCFARELLGVPSMVALGIEADEVIFHTCTKNLLHICRSSVVHADSESFASFYLEDCRFGKSTYTYNVWFRVTPMNQTCKVFVDKRIQKMLAGVIILLL